MLYRNITIKYTNVSLHLLPTSLTQCTYSELHLFFIYKIPCNDCSWNYIGETGRCPQTRKKEHIRNVKYCNKGSNVANHAWINDHQIDFKNARVIDKGDYRVRKTLESWHTAMTTEADNMLGHYPDNILFF